jgi:hypothetical protein
VVDLVAAIDTAFNSLIVAFDKHVLLVPVDAHF